MPLHISHQHTNSVWASYWKVVEIAANAGHGRVSCRKQDLFDRRNFPWKNCFLNLLGSPHFIHQ
jgi:hypothetical protein